MVHDLTGACRAFVSSYGGEQAGLLHVFVPHATAGIAILETGAGSDDDLLAALADLLPADDRWRHRHGSPGHGRSHVMPALVPPYATVPVVGGRLLLGTWQSICLVDLNVDNPDREVRLSFLARLQPMTSTPREQPWSDDRPEHGRILVLSANPISAAIETIATTAGREVVVVAEDEGGPGLVSLAPVAGDAVVLCDHDAPDAPRSCAMPSPRPRRTSR